MKVIEFFLMYFFSLFPFPSGSRLFLNMLNLFLLERRGGGGGKKQDEILIDTEELYINKY
jgi:hypothetical protein